VSGMNDGVGVIGDGGIGGHVVITWLATSVTDVFRWYNASRNVAQQRTGRLMKKWRKGVPVVSGCYYPGRMVTGS